MVVVSEATTANQTYHTPVLLNEVIAHLLTSKDGVYVDATVGGGGHAEAILMCLSSSGRLICFDRDGDAVTFVENRLQHFKPRVTVIHDNFVNMKQVFHTHNIQKVDGIFFDLGLSSFQVDHPGKGFSFQRDEPLDMRMDKRQTLTAATLLAGIDEQTLGRILREYGEEYHARKIARAIVRERITHPIETTGQLASVVRRVVRGQFVNKSLARVFQALRIAVNDELNALKQALSDAIASLRSRGRIVVISYHSLEDRIVKGVFRTEAGVAPGGGLNQSARLLIVTKKPLTPSHEEIAVNKRARSAKMRVAERI